MSLNGAVIEYLRRGHKLSHRTALLGRKGATISARKQQQPYIPQVTSTLAAAFKSKPSNPQELRTARRVGLPILLVAAVVIFVGVAVVLRAYTGLTASVEAKILGIAFAVGLDVLALSIAVGIMQIGVRAKLRLALAFSFAEVLMQVVGYALGTGAGRAVGAVAVYIGFAILAGVGVFIIRESFEKTAPTFKADSGWGLVAACASISLDSLGIGVSLPGVPLPLGPLLATIAVSTVVFTTMGLAFGERLGRRYRQKAQRAAGIVLVILAVVFTIQHILGWSA